ncbi:MAG: hypothetical protein Q8R04_02715 [Nanoarchaeota archaeon]|nr:hypothetical protein [Nanoarchaeota archaeon]
MTKVIEDTKRKKLIALAGAWEDDEEIEGIFKKIIADRHRTKARKAEF